MVKKKGPDEPLSDQSNVWGTFCFSVCVLINAMKVVLRLPGVLVYSLLPLLHLVYVQVCRISK